MMPFSPELDPDAENEQGEWRVILLVWGCSLGFLLTLAVFLWYERDNYVARHHHAVPNLYSLLLWTVGLGP